MKRLLFQKINILLFVAGMFASCTEDFDISTENSPPVVVIYGTFSNIPDYQYVSVSSSSPYFDTVPNHGISGATVSIKSAGGTVSFVEIDTVPGKYVTTGRVAGIPGVEYTLDVTVNFNGKQESYSAKSTMLAPVPVDSVKVSDMRLMGRDLYSLLYYGQDPPTEDFYLLRFTVNDSLILFERISRLVIWNDTGFNGQYINGMFVRGFSSISEKEKHDRDAASSGRKNERTYLSVGDTVALSLSRIEKGYYNFITQCKQERNGENPFFGGPPSNIITNLTGNATGYFACYAFSEEKSTVIKE